MSTVFHCGPGETENGQRFGSDSKAGSVASIRKFVHESSIRRPACLQFRHRRGLESEQKDTGFAVSSNYRAVECAVLSAERDLLGTADATVDPEAANFVATRKFHVR